jgi:hypothetical protein
MGQVFGGAAMDGDSNDRPKRLDGLDINEVADGYVIHDKDGDKIQYLNHTAALVLEYCNGELTKSEIIELLRLAYRLDEPPTREVTDCLEKLRSEGLIQ